MSRARLLSTVRLLRPGAIACLWGFCSALSWAAAADAEILRLGFSYAMFSGINENDARASIRALATTIARERKIPADFDPHLYDGTTAAALAVQRGEINALGLTVEEFWLLREEIDFNTCLIGLRGDDPHESYVVLAPRESDVRALSDLARRRLAVVPGPRMCLAPMWLDLELAKVGQPAAADLVDRTVSFAKPAKAVLAVFFRQIDACVVSRRAFETMIELNPQVATEVRVIAASPEFVPALFALSPSLPPTFLARLLREFGVLHTSVSGQQVLTIFQTERVAGRPLTSLDSAFRLLDEYTRAYPAASAARRAALRDPRTVAKPPP